MPMRKMENEHEQLVSMVNQLVDEREKLSRENQYLKSKLNQSILIETIEEMKKERQLLFQLLTNLTIREKHISTFSHGQNLDYKSNPIISNHTPRLRTNYEQPIRKENVSFKHLPTNRKQLYIYKTSTSHDFHLKSIRKIDNNQLKHSQNSPFKHYRSQSLQDLT